MEKQQQQNGCQCLVMYACPSVILHKLCNGALLGSVEQAVLCAQHIQLDNLPKAEYTFVKRLFVLMLHTTLCGLSYFVAKVGMSFSGVSLCTDIHRQQKVHKERYH